MPDMIHQPANASYWIRGSYKGGVSLLCTVHGYRDHAVANTWIKTEGKQWRKLGKEWSQKGAVPTHRFLRGCLSQLALQNAQDLVQIRGLGIAYTLALLKYRQQFEGKALRREIEALERERRAARSRFGV